MKIFLITLSTGDVALVVNQQVIYSQESNDVGESPADVAEKLSMATGYPVSHVNITPHNFNDWTWSDIIDQMVQRTMQRDDEVLRIRLTADMTYQMQGLHADELKQRMLNLFHLGRDLQNQQDGFETKIIDSQVKVNVMADGERALIDVLPHEATNDYELHETATSVWIKVQNTAIHIQNQLNAVSISAGVYGIPFSLVDKSPMVVNFDDCERMLLEEADLTYESLQKWASDHAVADIDSLSYAARAQLVGEFLNSHHHSGSKSS